MRTILTTATLSTILSLCCAISPAAFAQDAAPATAGNSAQAGQYGGHHGPMSPDEELTHLTRALKLSSDQQTQIKPILQDRHDQLMQMHQDASLSREARGAKMKSLDDDSNTKLEATLNDQQKAKYEKMVADRKARMQEMHARHMNGGNNGADAGTPPQ